MSDTGQPSEGGAVVAPLKIFISYARQDKKQRKRLAAHLAPLRREGLVATWHDRMIEPGATWADVIDRNLAEAGLVLLLVSADFVASDYCMEKEMALALARHRAGSLRVIPILIRPVDFRSTLFGALQALPHNGKPVSAWPDTEEAWYDVARSLRKIVEQSMAASVSPGDAALTTAEAPSLLAGMSGYRAVTGISNLLGHYLGSTPGTPTFGGRGRTLAELHQWLRDDTAPRRLLVWAPAGFGKTALLCRFCSELASSSAYSIAFLPISNRYDTQRESEVLPPLLARLAYLHAISLPDQSGAGSAAWRVQLHELLRRPLPTGQTLLLVLDGLDEAIDWAPDRTLLPYALPDGVRVIVTARPLAGDSQDAGWRRRLDWNSPTIARSLSLDLLTIEEVREVATNLGLPLRQDLESSVLVTELHDLSGGDPLTLRLRVEDLLRDLPLGTLPEHAKLRRLPRGLAGYLEDLCGPSSLGGDDPTLPAAALQSLVALAKAPLSRSDLAELTPELADAGRWQQALTRLRRILIGDGGSQGFVYSHSRLRDFFAERLTAQNTRALQQRFVDYGKRCLDALRLGRLPPAEVSPYLLTCLSAHLTDVAAPATEQLLLVCEPWLRAWFAREQSYDGFLRDIERAQRAAEAEFQASYQESVLLGILRCVLCRQIVEDLSGKIYPQLLRALLREHLWTAARALASIRHVREHGTQSFDPLLEAVAAYLPSELLWDVSALVLERMQSPYDSGRSAQLLAPLLAQSQPDRALHLAHQIPKEWLRAHYLIALLPSLDGALRLSTTDWALRLVRRLPTWGRAKGLVALARALPPGDPRAESLLTEAWKRAPELSEKDQFSLWNQLLPDFPPELAAAQLACVIDELLTSAEPYILASMAGVFSEWDPNVSRPLLNAMAAHSHGRSSLLSWASAAHEVAQIGRPLPDPCARWQQLRNGLDPARYAELRGAYLEWIQDPEQLDGRGPELLQEIASELSADEQQGLRQLFQHTRPDWRKAHWLCVLAQYGDASARIEALTTTLAALRDSDQFELLRHAIALLAPEQWEQARRLVAERLADLGPDDERARYARIFAWLFLMQHDLTAADSLRQQAEDAIGQLIDPINKIHALFALAVRTVGEHQQRHLLAALEGADEIGNSRQKYECLRFLARDLNEPFRERLLSHAIDQMSAWSQRDQWNQLHLLLKHTDITDALRSDLRARALRLGADPSDGSLFWYDYLAMADLGVATERHLFVKKAEEAAFHVRDLGSVAAALTVLAPDESVLKKLLERIRKELSAPEQFRLLCRLYPIASTPIQFEMGRMLAQQLAGLPGDQPQEVRRAAELMQYAPAVLQPGLAATLLSLTRKLVTIHGPIIRTSKRLLTSELGRQHDECSAALRTAAKALTPNLASAELDEVLTWIPQEAQWSDVLGPLLGRIQDPTRRSVMFQKLWEAACSADDPHGAINLAWLAPYAPEHLRSEAIAEAFRRARLIELPSGGSTDSRQPVVVALAEHLSVEHAPIVTQCLISMLQDHDGNLPLNIPLLLLKMPAELRISVAGALLATDSPLPMRQQVLLRLTLAAADPRLIAAALLALNSARDLIDPAIAAALAQIAPLLSEAALDTALELLLSSPSVNQTPATWLPSLGLVAKEYARSGRDVREPLARAVLQSVKTPAPGLHYLLPRIADMASSFAVLGIRPAAVAKVLLEVTDWFH